MVVRNVIPVIWTSRNNILFSNQSIHFHIACSLVAANIQLLGNLSSNSMRQIVTELISLEYFVVNYGSSMNIWLVTHHRLPFCFLIVSSFPLVGEVKVTYVICLLPWISTLFFQKEETKLYILSSSIKYFIHSC